MENKDILLLKHHHLNVHYTNPFYTNQTDNDLSKYTVIDVTSRVERNKQFMADHPGFAKDLSPFFIGPVVSSDGTAANIFEIFWQCGKVYPCHDNNGKPNKEYFDWRNHYYSKTTCTRDLMRHSCHSIGYENKDARYFAYYDANKNDYIPLDYIEARKRVYFPEYAKLVVNTASYKWLKSLVDSGQKIALVDFDACNYNEACAMRKQYESYVNKCKKEKIAPSQTETDFLNIHSMKDLVNAPFMRVGHGCVLKMLLQGDIEVKNGQVIDHEGIMK